MTHVAHQCICMQYLIELAKQLETDPRACISSFFTKIQVADQDYKDAFYSELDAFKVRIVKRAKEKIAEAEEEERKERLGPGGLDPADVFESLPEPMQKCFMEQDIEMLQTVIKELPEDEARQQRNDKVLTQNISFSFLQIPHEEMRGFWPLVSKQGGPGHQRRGRVHRDKQTRGRGRGGGVRRGQVDCVSPLISYSSNVLMTLCDFMYFIKLQFPLAFN